jgi:hypothetical protein
MPKWESLKPDHVDPIILRKWGDKLFPEKAKKKKMTQSTANLNESNGFSRNKTMV